jgi:hypothetical protein
MHPLDAFAHWYRGLEPDFRAHFAFIVTAGFPTENAKLSHEMIGDAEAYLDRWIAPRGHYAQDMGRTLLVRSLVEFFIVREWETPEYWARAKETNEYMMGRAQEEGTPRMVEQMKKIMGNFPRWSEGWMAICKTWHEIRQSLLSDESLAQWMKEASRQQSERHLQEMSAPIQIHADVSPKNPLP